MKILIVTPIFPPEIGGPATYTSELLGRFSEDLHIVSFSDLNNCSDSRVTLVSVQGGMLVRQLKFLWACLTRGFGSDIVYIQEPAVVGLAGLVTGLIFHKPIVTKYVGDPAWEEARRQRQPEALSLTLDDFLALPETHRTFLFRITSLVLSRSSHVVVPSHYLRKVLLTSYKLKPKNVLVIPNAIASPKIKLPPRKHQFVVIGRLVNWKNIDLIIEAFKKTNLLKYKLVVIGDGPDLKFLKEKAVTLGIKSQVVFSGRLPAKETLKKIAESSAFILFSDYEGLPHVVLEAMSLKTPVIASNIPGTNEVAIKGRTAILVNPRDVSELAAALKASTHNSSTQRRYSEAGAKLVAEKYNWSTHCRILLKSFRGLV